MKSFLRFIFRPEILPYGGMNVSCQQADSKVVGQKLTSVTLSDEFSLDSLRPYYRQILSCLAVSFFLLLNLTVRPSDVSAHNVNKLYGRSPQVNLSLIAQIESSGNPSAVNLKDHAGKGSRGLFQISEGLRADYNRLNKRSISALELLKPEVNTQVAVWAFSYYYPLLLTKVMKRPVTVRNLIICHNAGCGKVNNPPAHTLKVYLPKYKKLGGAL